MNFNYDKECEKISSLWEEFGLHFVETNKPDTSWFFKRMKRMGYTYINEGVNRQVWLSKNHKHVVKIGDTEDNSTEIMVYDFLRGYFEDRYLPVLKILGKSKDMAVLACEKLHMMPPKSSVICYNPFTKSVSKKKSMTSISKFLRETISNVGNIIPADLHDDNILFRKIKNKFYPVVCDAGHFDYFESRNDAALS